MSDHPPAPNTLLRTGPFAWFRASRQNTIIGSLIVLVSCCACGGLANAGNHGSSPNHPTIAIVSTTSHATTTITTPEKTVPTTVTPSVPASTATLAPAHPTQAPATATPIPPPVYPAVGGNPWDYTLTNTGHLIYTPPSNFCDTPAFTCIPSFWKSTNGYVDECYDGMYSHSGGVQGACSKHGNEKQPLYQP